mmetsp:Transcript_33065/g.65127  ORF Transcript_33065/g.65127 Transcript_33065/m.65127 type:complete len:240 (-) Transcript_33065:1895-2614(-)
MSSHPETHNVSFELAVKYTCFLVQVQDELAAAVLGTLDHIASPGLLRNSLCRPTPCTTIHTPKLDVSDEPARSYDSAGQAVNHNSTICVKSIPPQNFNGVCAGGAIFLNNLYIVAFERVKTRLAACSQCHSVSDDDSEAVVGPVFVEAMSCYILRKMHAGLHHLRLAMPWQIAFKRQICTVFHCGLDGFRFPILDVWWLDKVGHEVLVHVNDELTGVQHTQPQYHRIQHDQLLEGLTLQ